MFYNSARDQGKSGRGTVAGRQRQRQRWRMRPTLLALEGRTLLSTFTVTNNASQRRWLAALRDRPGEYSPGANAIVFGLVFQHAADDHPVVAPSSN